jgi:hypothetical protein
MFTVPNDGNRINELLNSQKALAALIKGYFAIL